MTWSLIVHKNTIENFSTALQALSFRSLSLYPLFPLKTRIPLQFLKQAFSILYMFSPFSFVFIFFFQWNMCFLIVLPPWRKGAVGFPLKLNNLMWLKAKRFLFILTDNHTEIWDVIFSAIKNERSHLCD